NLKFDHTRRIEAHLLIRDRIDLAVMHAVGAAQHAPAAAQAIGESESRREVGALAAIWDGAETVHLGRRGYGLVAQTVIQRQLAADVPVVAKVETHVPVA